LYARGIPDGGHKKNAGRGLRFARESDRQLPFAWESPANAVWALILNR